MEQPDRPLGGGGGGQAPHPDAIAIDRAVVALADKDALAARLVALHGRTGGEPPWHPDDPEACERFRANYRRWWWRLTEIEQSQSLKAELMRIDIRPPAAPAAPWEAVRAEGSVYRPNRLVSKADWARMISMYEKSKMPPREIARIEGLKPQQVYNLLRGHRRGGAVA